MLQKDLAACLRRHETLGGLRRLWLFPSSRFCKGLHVWPSRRRLLWGLGHVRHMDSEQLQTSAHRLGRFVVLFLFLCRGSLLSSGSIVRVRRARRQQEIPKAGSATRQHYDDDVGLHVLGCGVDILGTNCITALRCEAGSL